MAGLVLIGLCLVLMTWWDVILLHTLCGVTKCGSNTEPKNIYSIKLHINVMSIDLLQLVDFITAVDSRVKVVFHWPHECNCLVGFIEAPDLERRVIFQNSLMFCVMRGTSVRYTKGVRRSGSRDRAPGTSLQDQGLTHYTQRGTASLHLFLLIGCTA